MATRSRHEIITPKAARPAFRPQPRTSVPVARMLRSVMKSPPPQPQPFQAQRAVVSKSRHEPARVASKKPTVRIITRDPPESSIRRLREIHNSCTGRILVIIANGPSVLEVETKELLNNPRVDIMSINKPDMRVWPTKYWLFCDTSQIKRNHGLWSGYDGCIFNSMMISETRPGTVLIKNIPGMGFSTDLTRGFHVGRSSVYASMQVALWLGYDAIYIVGIDMGSVSVNGEDVLHFYGQNPDCTADSRKRRFADEAKYYENAARELPENARKKFYFCSSYNKFEFVNSFNRLDHKKTVETVLAQQ